jgi:hypothetical protein
MKTRDGFVSNSSSSSFVAIISKDAFDLALSEAHPYIQAVVEAMGKQESTFMGNQVVTMGTMDMHGSSTFEYLDINYDTENSPMPEEDGEEINAYTAWETFLESIPQGMIVSHSEDF